MSKFQAITISKYMKTTSMQVARYFEKPHDKVIVAIELIKSRLPAGNASYGDIYYIDASNRKQRAIEMNRDGFSLLAMGFKGDKAFEWKLKFLAAFNAMEQALIKENDKLEWKTARLQIKQTRKSFTNAVADFVEYATAQGSQSAKMYYANITKMEYAALDLLDRQKTTIGNFRDTLDLMEVSTLMMAEVVAKGALEQGMKEKLHYKEIYILAKKKVKDYADSISFLKLN
jgi:Rha family phage regulatory protein